MSLDSDLKIAYDLLNRRKLRWCSGGICACMGCANREISKETWDRIIQIPEISAILEQRRLDNQASMRDFLQRLKERKI